MQRTRATQSTVPASATVPVTPHPSPTSSPEVHARDSDASREACEYFQFTSSARCPIGLSMTPSRLFARNMRTTSCHSNMSVYIHETCCFRLIYLRRSSHSIQSSLENCISAVCCSQNNSRVRKETDVAEIQA